MIDIDEIEQEEKIEEGETYRNEKDGALVPVDWYLERGYFPPDADLSEYEDR